MSMLSIDVSAKTDTGRIRNHNEDAALAKAWHSEHGKARALLVVADGMGGHLAGEVASQLIVDEIWQTLSWMFTDEGEPDTNILASSAPPDYLPNRLKQAVAQANEAVCEYRKNNLDSAGNMGAAATCALIDGHVAAIANVGDSRTYLWRNNELIQLTKDHSFVGELLQQGHITADEIYDHPRRNLITRAVGETDLEIDTFVCNLKAGDTLLLCSDGLWEMVRKLAETIQPTNQLSLNEAVDILIEAANNHGGRDNIGIAMARIAHRDD